MSGENEIVEYSRVFVTLGADGNAPDVTGDAGGIGNLNFGHSYYPATPTATRISSFQIQGDLDELLAIKGTVRASMETLDGTFIQAVDMDGSRINTNVDGSSSILYLLTASSLPASDPQDVMVIISGADF